jgi:undecaprenyl-diphosphatase
VEAALKKGFAEVTSENDAAKILAEVEEIAGKAKEGDIPNVPSGVQPGEQAAAIKAAAEGAVSKERPAAVLAETARQVAASPPAAQPVLDAGIEKAAGTSPSARAESPEVQRGRSLLRRELMRRLKPLDAIDASLFLQINHLWHSKGPDRFFSWLSFLMTGGHAWVLAILVRTLVDRRRGVREFFDLVPPLYLATLTIEGPIKAYCRRRRPFISLIRAIVVGRKPGSYSFPSGHSAAAFAGASLLLRHHSRLAPLLVGIASLVAFSRVYLGAHYPGDVLSGGLAGTVLARAYQCALRRLFGSP